MTLQLTAIELTAEVEMERGALVLIENPIEDTQYARLREQGLSMRMLNLHGQSVQDYGPYTDLPPPQLDMTVPNQPGEFTTITDPNSQDPLRVYTSPVVQSNQVVGILQVALNLNNVRGTLDSLLITLLLGVPLIVIVAGSGGYFLAARALVPIDKITRTARHISANELSARLNLPQTDDDQ